MFLKVGAGPKAAKQRLYVLEITLPSGMVVSKVGKASGANSKSRMMQICESIFDKFRCTPSIRIKRDREVPAEEVFKMETTMHRFLADYRYETTHKWSGCTEAFVVPIEDVVAAYDLVVEGAIPDFTYTLPPQEEDELTF